MPEPKQNWGDPTKLNEKLAAVRELEGRERDHCGEMYRRPGHQKRREIVSAIMKQLVPGHSFLDVGCAEGMYCGLAWEFGATSVVGVDISASKIERARKRLPQCSFHCKDATDLRGAVGLFDVVLCSEVLQHIPDYLAFAAAVLDCVNPGGRAILTAPNLAPSVEHIAADVSDTMEVEELLRQIGGAGFGKQNAVWRFNTDRLYGEIVAKYGVRLEQKTAVDTPDGVRKNLWTIGVFRRAARTSPDLEGR